jgi:hypothetical protein
MPLVDTIELAMANLGGDAPYSTLYKEVGRLRRRELTENEEAHVRLVIQTHSVESEVDARRKQAPLFFSVGGLGSGHWGLLRKATIPPH